MRPGKVLAICFLRKVSPVRNRSRFWNPAVRLPDKGKKNLTFQNEFGNCVAPGLGKFPKSPPRVKRECVPRSARAELRALISLFLPRPIIVRNQWRSNLATKANGTRGLRPVRPAGILPAVLAAQFQRSRTPLNQHFGSLCSWSMAIQHQSRFASFQHGTVAPSPLFKESTSP